MATTGTTAQALAAAEAELSALETEATLLPRRLLLAAQVGTPLDVAALRARQELLPERLLAARDRVLRCRLAHLEAERAAAETAVVAASEALAAQQARPDTPNVEGEPAAAPDARLLDAVARVKEIEAARDDVARQLALLSGGGSGAPAGAEQPA